jgi:Pyridoxamine 5'-phosphate oxidase
MASWAEFALAGPEIEAAGRRSISRAAGGTAFLATIRGDGLPRINPVTVEIIDGRLVSFVIVDSAKFGDLSADGRYALHAYQDPAAPTEFQVRGRAHLVTEPGLRATAVASWSFEADDSYRLFEFSVEQAVLGERSGPDEWPPNYSSWRSPAESAG